MFKGQKDNRFKGRIYKSITKSTCFRVFYFILFFFDLVLLNLESPLRSFMNPLLVLLFLSLTSAAPANVIIRTVVVTAPVQVVTVSANGAGPVPISTASVTTTTSASAKPTTSSSTSTTSSSLSSATSSSSVASSSSSAPASAASSVLSSQSQTGNSFTTPCSNFGNVSGFPTKVNGTMMMKFVGMVNIPCLFYGTWLFWVKQLPILGINQELMSLWKESWIIMIQKQVHFCYSK